MTRASARTAAPYVANGSHESGIIEIKAHKRRIVRPRGAAAVFRHRTRVWTHVLHERFACMRPLRCVAGWLTDQGLSPGTLASSTSRMLPLFEPLRDAILAHRNEAGLRHADETDLHR